jgi:hypothetical protein
VICVQAARLLAFFTANRSTDAERVATLAQHEGFLDPSSIVRGKDGAAEDAAKVAKKPAKSRPRKERRADSGEKRTVKSLFHMFMHSVSIDSVTESHPMSLLCAHLHSPSKHQCGEHPSWH